MHVLNSRLPQANRLNRNDLRPVGPMIVYQATLQRRYVLVRAGNRQHGNAIDTTVEV
ncbi:MAG: hypothetical protein ABI632_11170 [Pseudolysinimonas sp.]